MSADASRARVALAFACIFLVWGTTYLAIAVVLRSLPPFASAALRFLLAALLLYGWLRLRDPAPLRALPTGRVIASGILMCGCGNGLTVFAIQGVPSGTAALLNATIPISVALLDWGFFGGRRPGTRTAIGLVTGVAGVAVIVHQTASFSGLKSGGYLAALALAVTCWSVGTLVQRHSVPRARLLALGCGQMAAGAAFLLLVAVLRGEWRTLDLASVSAAGWLSLLYLAVFGSVLAQSSYLWLLSRLPAEKVTTYAIANPMVALLLGAVVLGEPVSGASLLGALLVLAGVSLVLFDRTLATLLAGISSGLRRRRRVP